MTELEEKIKQYADAYYQGEELISDAEYDALIVQLKKENPNSEILKGVTGTDIKGVSKKYKLPHCMNTLDKCADEKAFKTWWGKHPLKHWMTSLKIDGNSQLLLFKNGKLVQCLSRGDGVEGEDTTINVSKINFPKELKKPLNGGIRGEVYLKRSVWEKHFKGTKNPRNAAAGVVKRLDGKGMEYLSFCAYEVFDDDGVVDKTEQSKFAFLEDEGFDVAPHEFDLPFDKIVEWKNNLQPNGEIPCDGLVIKPNDVDKVDTERQVPLNMCAFKPNLQMAVTTAHEIEWSMKGRYLSPVVIIDPVELEGTTVERASMSNVNIMQGIYVGAQVMVSKRGLIIPKIEKILNPKPNAFQIPTVCPACGEPLIVNDSGMVECKNEGCPRKMAHRFRKMFKTFGIKYTGDKFIQNLEDEGVTIEDFLKMCKSNDKKVLNKYSGNSNGEKVYEQMRNIGPITAAQFLAIFDAPMLDEKRFLLFGNKTLDELIFLSCKSKEEVMKFKGIGEEIADLFLDFFNKNSKEIIALRQYFTFESVYATIEENNGGGKKMSMPTICFTGACPGFTRSELTEKCQGKYDVKDSVTKDLDYLACADPNSGSSKLQKAAKNGTKIISYTELLQSL